MTEVQTTRDQFVLQHIDGTTRITVTFNAVFTDELVRQMVDFIRGCGHHDDNIYGAMAQVAEEYFECKEKPVPVVPWTHENVT
jgi:hypothetical protein